MSDPRACVCVHRLLARCASQYANRRHKDVTTAERAEELVKAGGLSCLEALVMLPLSDEVRCARIQCVRVCAADSGLAGGHGRRQLRVEQEPVKSKHTHVCVRQRCADEEQTRMFACELYNERTNA